MTTKAGRPRSETAQTAILQATLQLVTERGFRAVTVNDIAAQAAVGKMTIYRRWPNKSALVMDALLTLIGDETAFPPGKNALDSLRLQLDLQAAFFRSERGTLIRSLVAEAQSDPELATAFRERWLFLRRDRVRRCMEQAIEEGGLRKDINIDVAIDMLYGAIYYRLLLGSGPMDKEFIDAAFHQFCAGHAA